MKENVFWVRYTFVYIDHAGSHCQQWNLFICSCTTTKDFVSFSSFSWCDTIVSHTGSTSKDNHKRKCCDETQNGNGINDKHNGWAKYEDEEEWIRFHNLTKFRDAISICCLWNSVHLVAIQFGISNLCFLNRFLPNLAGSAASIICMCI